MKTYRELAAWNHAMDLANAVYDLTENFPTHQQYALSAQMQRAAISVPSNIAEGYGRAHRKEYVQFLYISRGSIMELETQLVLAQRRNYVDRETALQLWDQLQETGKVLNGLITSLKSPRTKNLSRRRQPDVETLNPEP